MTIEKLEKATKLADRIKNLEEFQNVFQRPCIRNILAYRIVPTDSVTLSIEKDSKLYKFIDDYIKNELEQSKKQLEEI